MPQFSDARVPRADAWRAPRRCDGGAPSLVKQDLIKAARGEITVLDRKGLEASAGGSYGVPEREYSRLLDKGRSSNVFQGRTPPTLELPRILPGLPRGVENLAEAADGALGCAPYDERYMPFEQVTALVAQPRSSYCVKHSLPTSNHCAALMCVRPFSVSPPC